MLATAERPRGRGEAAEIVWHLLADQSQAYDGDEDFHAIACAETAEDGIHMPGGVRDLSLQEDLPGQRWCQACLAAKNVTTSWLTTAA